MRAQVNPWSTPSGGERRTAEKGNVLGQSCENIPQGLKPPLTLLQLMYGLKPVPFTGWSFSAACRAPFDCASVAAGLKRRPFKATTFLAAYTALLLVVCGGMGFGQGPAAQSSAPVELNRVVAVVNNRAILSSDIADEMRLSVLDPNTAGRGSLTPQRALQQLISRAMIQQQIREEDLQASEPSKEQVDQRLAEIRKELPVCVRQNCVSDAGWAVFLSKNELTQEQVESYLRLRLEILGFIEIRFRQGIRISEEEIEGYYKKTLLAQYATGEPVPTLAVVSPRIEEILLQQQVNALFGAWLDNLRKQGDVEVLDPTLETAPSAAEGNGGR